MTIKLAPGFNSLWKLTALLLLPMLLYALVSTPNPGMILLNILLVVLFALSLWFCMGVTIKLEEGYIDIRYLNYHYHDKLENLYPEASYKFHYRKDSRLGLKKLFQGISLSGFHVGWYILRNRAPGFVCLTRREKARALASRDGSYLLLDPAIANRIEDYLKS